MREGTDVVVEGAKLTVRLRLLLLLDLGDSSESDLLPDPEVLSPDVDLSLEGGEDDCNATSGSFSLLAATGVSVSTYFVFNGTKVGSDGRYLSDQVRSSENVAPSIKVNLR